MAEISYTKTNWVNNVTKLNADNMNHIEDGIEALDTALNTKASVDYVNKTHYGYSGDDLLIIPEGTTTIGENAYINTNYKCVIIPDSVTSIGFRAFNGCTSLTSITIPNKVTSIGNGAFNGCRSLTSITIPNSVTSIGIGTFYSCPLITIDLTAYTTQSFPTLGNNNFNAIASDCQIKVIKGRKNDLIATEGWSSYASYVVEVETADTAVITAKDYTNKTHYGYSGDDLLIIPEGTTTIANEAYASTNYKCVVIPDSVTSIGNGAFKLCDGLTSITIPDSVTSIDMNVFRYCNHLTSITIGNGVTSIGIGAFYGCPLNTIDLTAYATQSFPTIGDYNFGFISSDCQIKIAKGRKNDLIATSGWSNYANYVVEVPTVETLDATKLDKTGGTVTGNLSVEGNISATDGVMSASQVNTTNIYSDGNGGYVEGANIDVVNVKNLNIVEGGAGISFEGGKFISTTGDAELSSITTTGDVTVGGNLTVQGATISGISDSAGTSSTIAMSQKGVADAIAAAITSELTTEV